MKRSKTLTIKNRTNGGDRCNNHFFVYGNDKSDVALYLHKYILSKDPIYADLALPLKTFRGKTLWFQEIGIRLNTLKVVADWLNTLGLENEFK